MRRCVFYLFMTIAFTLNAQTKLSSYVRPELQQYKKSFVVAGKKYTMYWVDRNKDLNPTSKGVSDIYIVPDNFKPISFGNKNDENFPPCIDKLILHDIPGKEFLEAVLSEKSTAGDGSATFHTYGFRLPDDIANEIVDLACGDTSFNLNPMLQKFGSTTSATLTPYKSKFGNSLHTTPSSPCIKPAK